MGTYSESYRGPVSCIWPDATRRQNPSAHQFPRKARKRHRRRQRRRRATQRGAAAATEHHEIFAHGDAAGTGGALVCVVVRRASCVVGGGRTVTGDDVSATGAACRAAVGGEGDASVVERERVVIVCPPVRPPPRRALTDVYTGKRGGSGHLPSVCMRGCDGRWIVVRPRRRSARAGRLSLVARRDATRRRAPAGRSVPRFGSSQARRRRLRRLRQSSERGDGSVVAPGGGGARAEPSPIVPCRVVSCRVHGASAAVRRGPSRNIAA